MPSSKPIIFLAFANDRQAGGAYLRNLGQEAERLRDVLTPAEKAGLCQVEIRTSVSAEGVLSPFYDPAGKDRIAIFHYAGHAEDYALLLESANGDHALADGRGLAAFLRYQRGLQLVFLNACSTQAQVAGLLDAGVAAVVATSRAIDDQTASDFARHFYSALVSGDSISAAFEKAQAALHFVRGDLTRHLRPLQDAQAEHSAAGWPWALYLRKGAEEVAAWNLPGAANDPLFGLDLPAIDLPVAPYPEKLQWYDASYAPVFFGRGQDIRALYNRVTANGGDPIILFYGQSGVGKSSLLAAGLMPRLAAQQSVVYYRRDQNKGLLGSLIAALADANASTTTGVDVLHLWLQREHALGKPLTILLDQVEELYTRSASAQPNELADFLTALRTLFLDPAQRPQGKLILGFRKEWLAEIEKQLADAHLPRTAVFLRRMDGRGVVETVLGPTSTLRLQQKYGLQVEAVLAEEIARDLVKDAEAAVAPTLQILLSKLWAEAKQINRTQPHYDRALYDRLRGEGFLLKDFLDQQLKELHAEHAAAVTSGLALDLLAFHTSEHGAAERTRQTLHDTYQHVQATVDGLLQSFQRRYLLVDPAPDQENSARPTRLAHDTLAPLVRARFDESDTPGQRARRILETRTVAWEDNPATTQSISLDQQDLAVVEQGATGMRIWTAAEQRLVMTSRQRDAKRRRNLRIWQGIGIAAIVLIVATAWIAFIQRDLALQGESKANAAKDEAQKSARVAKVAELVAQTQGLLQENDVDPSPNLPLMLARRAVLTTLTADNYVTAEAEANLQRAIENAPPWIMSIPPKRHSDPVMSLDLSLDGQTLLSASSDLTARLWNLHNGQEIQRFVGHNGPVWSARFSPDGQQIVTASVDGTVRLWDVASGQELLQMRGHKGTVWSAIYSIDGRSIFSAGEDYTVWMWDATTGRQLRQFVGHGGRVLAVAASPDGKLLASAGADRVIRLWEIATGREEFVLDGHDAIVTALRFLQQGNLLISGDSEGMLRLWDTVSGTELQSWQAQETWISSLAVNQAESLVATASHDGTIGLWEIASGKALTAPLGVHGSAVNAVVFTPDDKQLFSGSDDQSIRRWDIASGKQLRFLFGHTAPVVRVLYSSDGKLIVSADQDGTILLHDPLTGNQIVALPNAGPLLTLDLSADNRTIVSGSGDQTIRLWDIISRTTVAQQNAHAGTVLAVKFSPDNTLLATAGSDNLACLWQLWPLQKSNCLEHPNSVRTIAFTADSKTLITGCDDGKLRFWDVATQQNLTTTETLTEYGTINVLRISPDGRQLAAAIDTNIALWDLPWTGQLPQTLIGHTGVVNALVYGRDRKTFVSAGSDKAIRRWDLSTGQAQSRLDGHETSTQSATLYDGVTSVDISPDGKTLVTSGTDNTLRFWDIRSDRLNGRLEGEHSGQLASATVSRRGQYAVTAGYADGLVVVWNLATEQPLFSFKTDDVHVTFALLSQDETLLAAGYSDGLVRLWHWQSEQLLQEFRHPQWPWRLAFAPASDRLAVASWDGTAYVWDIASGQTIFQLSANPKRLWSVQFSHDGQRIVTSGEDRQVHVWDAVQGTLLHSFPLEGIRNVPIAIFSPDDQAILVGVDAVPFGSNATGADRDQLAADFALRLLDANTGQPIRQYVGHNNTITWADFDASGQMLVTASTDETIRLWDVRSEVELRKILQPQSITTAYFLPDDQTLITAGGDGVARIWPTVNTLLQQAERLTQREPALFWRAEQSRYQIQATLPNQ